MPTLHITNGDSAASTMRAFLADRVVITADPLFDGPAPDVPDATWYALRAGTLAPGAGAREREVRDALAAGDRLVTDAVRRRDDLVLWFEHDLFDQLLLIRTLERIDSHRPDMEAASVQLICIDRFPGIDRFVGLGQLTAEQLASLVSTKRPVSVEQYAVARRAWSAFRSSDPAALLKLTAAAESTSALPFLGDALHRFLQEYPSTRNGLSRSASAVLEALDEVGDGGLDAGPLFAMTQSREETPFMGDWSVFDRVRALAAPRVPLVAIDPPPDDVDLRGHRIAITEAGRAVRSGLNDAIRLNGIDEWHGGVHLAGDRESPWRWDATRETLVSLND